MAHSSYRRRTRTTGRKSARGWKPSFSLCAVAVIVLCIIGYLYLQAHGPLLIQLP